MNNLQVFNNEKFGQVRTIIENGEVLFCAFDIATALGYSIPRKAVSDHCKGVLKRNAPTAGGIQEMSFIPEGDVYRLVGRSKLPAAEKFERWVFDEVLPTIRKTGGYVANEEMFIETYLPFADDAMKTLFVSTLQIIRNQNQLLETQRPLVEFAEDILTSKENIHIGLLAKLMCKNATKIGRNRLFKLLRDENILMENNVPYQHYIDQGYFVVKDGANTTPYGSLKHKPTTLITPKGQVWVVNQVKRVIVDKGATE